MGSNFCFLEDPEPSIHGTGWQSAAAAKPRLGVGPVEDGSGTKAAASSNSVNRAYG